MKILSVGSVIYLGEVEELKGGKTIIKDALCLGSGVDVNKTHLAAYIKATNAGKLEKDISIKGLGATFSERELSDDLQLEFDILLMKMEQAEKLAVPELINRKFDELLGR